MSAPFSLRKLVAAIFNGVPANEDAAPYTAQITALISIYLCFIALFLIGLYIRRLKRRTDLPAELTRFWTWMAMALAFPVFWIAACLVYQLATGG